MSDQQRKIALFDFDGTLIPCDSQILFCSFVCRKHPWRRLLMLLYALFLPLAIFGKWGERILKRLFLVYLAGLRCDAVSRYASEFFEKEIRPILFENVLQKLQCHLIRGDFCVMATASPSVYAEAIGKNLGFDTVLSTEVETGKTIPFFPKLTYGNNKGSVKVDRLRDLEIISDRTVNNGVTAYSDSVADLPMLVIAEEKVLINPSSDLQEYFGSDKHTTILEPDIPWRTTLEKIFFCAGKFFGRVE